MCLLLLLGAREPGGLGPFSSSVVIILGSDIIFIQGQIFQKDQW